MSYFIQEEEGVLTFTIDRPHIRNAVNDEVTEGLEQFIKKAKLPGIRFAVITASGDQAFCSGGDLSVFHKLITEEDAFPMLDRMADVLYGIKTLPVPVIAIVNGAAVGGGCEIATACDYRLVRKGVKCGFIQGTLAITTGWGGGSYLFELLSYEKALHMLTQARTYTSDELLKIGWATEEIEGTEDAVKFMAGMKEIHPDVHRAYKEMAIRKWRSDGLKKRVDQEVRRCSQLWAHDAHHEAVDNFRNKRIK
ncbi:MAG TPA: enoyl-CoA hydratase/isomerase family protein [Planococcus sp. (in: firmicutes)]|nr:enoyl-CoA hydratase/isomerase family protein [Planococcus sp. (in: firmicutes)]